MGERQLRFCAGLWHLFNEWRFYDRFAAAREHGLSYSRMIHGLKVAGVEVDRKILAQLAIEDAQAFGELATLAKGP